MEKLDDIPANSMIGRRVGVYELEQEIGRGGMGVVYRARRIDGEFDQTVAVKLIKRGMDTDLVLKRFRRERQITAALNHPNVAYFFGGGSTEDGLPYFVMEFIDGLPLYKYCDRHKLNIKERLNIFRQICWAVAAAHEISVIHRDLKPSNILVKDDGKPKLLDFGIAKVLDPDLMATDIDPTATHLRVMTPEYASPEQIAGEAIGISTDIYSLGVILYELLTGHRPYTFSRKASGDAARVIKEQVPTSPSGSLAREESLLRSNGETPSLEGILQARNTSLDALRRELSGDLDKIVMKALRKDPAERYVSAVDFADDITNFLEHRPVNAEFFLSSPNISKAKGADKLSVAILPLRMLQIHQSNTGDEFFGIGLADALISRLSGLRRLVVRPTSSVLSFANSDPFEAGQHLGVDYILDGNVRISGSRIRVSVQLLSVAENSARWARAFDQDMRDVLELEDSIAGQVIGALLPQLSVEERNRLERRGTNVPTAYQAYLRGRYFVSRFTNTDLQKAVKSFEEAIELDPGYALPYIGIADYYIWSTIFGIFPSSEGFGKAQEAARRALEIDDALGEAYAALAFTVLLYDRDWDSARGLVSKALDLSPNYGFAHECHSNILTAQGRFDEGIAEIKIAEELDPMSPRAVLMTAWTLYQAGRADEAVAKARQGVEMQKDFPQGLLHLGNALVSAGKPSEAVAVLRESAEMWGAAGMPRYMLCHARAAEGNMGAARTILDKMLAVAERQYVKPYFIAMCYTAVGDRDNAFEWFYRALDEHNEMIWFATEPKLESLRGDPRYEDILRKTNNPIVETAPTYRGDTATTGETVRSIAVLPLRLVGGHDTTSSEDEYLAVGIADALTMRLSNVRRFLVRPTSSVLPFNRGDVDPFQAGRDLGVEYVLDGLIRHIGGRVRVTAQLLDVAEGSTRWAGSFAENFTDVLQLEDSISEQVTRQLVPHLTGEEKEKLSKRGTNDANAHDFYLKGRYFWNKFSPDAFPKAITAFSRAVKLDPNYALAHVGVADYYSWACIYGIHSPKEGYPYVLESASRALAIDPELAEAHSAMGLYLSNHRRWAEAEKAYRRAIDLNPNYPLAHEWLSSLLVGTGRFAEGTSEIILAEQLGPLSLRPKVLSAWTIYQTRDYEAALVKARELQHLDPEFMQTYLQLANILLEMGRTEEALDAARKACELEPESSLPLYAFVHALVGAGKAEEAHRTFERWKQTARSGYVPPYFLALCAVALGERDEAIDLFDKAFAEDSAWLLWLNTEPKLDTMRSDERFTALVQRAGLAA